MNTKVNLAGIILKNPVVTASGTSGMGSEISEYIDISKLGAFIPKSVTLKPRPGNPIPRTCETDAGMINSIGLSNKGIDYFLRETLPLYSQYNTHIIINISATSLEDFVTLAERISKDPNSNLISAFEINLSCPNDRQGKIIFSTDYDATYNVTKALKQTTDKPLIIKLTPNVSDIRKPAEAVYEAGGDALSMINTVLAMAIDVRTRKPKIHGGGTYMGGLSGPAIRPIGVARVYQVYKSENPLPIVGIGGIMTGEDAIEYILAGATAVQIGTGNFINPHTSINVIKGVRDYMKKYKINDINELRGQIKEP